MRRDVYHGRLIVGLIAGWSPDYPQVASILTPTTDSEAAPGPAEDVTVGDEGAVNGTSATIVPDPLPPPTSEDDGCTSVHTASTKQSSGTEGEGFASDVTWGGAYLEGVGDVKGRHVLGADWRDTCTSRVMVVDRVCTLGH